MSLTSFIEHRDFQELRDKFKTVFPRPAIKLRGELLAPPMTGNYSIVGQAFDYLLRFTLEHRYKSKVNSKGGWVADGSYTMIVTPLESSSAKVIRVGYRRDIEKNRKDFLKMLKDEYTTAKNNYEQFLNDGLLTDSLIKSALYLARLDVTFRAGMVDANLGNETEQDIQDVRQLFSIINHDHFKVENNCFINPTFGDGSLLVGGADGDLIIDDTLIDLKVTKSLAVERDYLNQTIAYYILSLIGGVNGDKSLKPIKNIGIYFARHGVLWKIPLTQLADEKSTLEFKDWFHKYADEKIWGGRLEEIKKQAAEKKKEAKPKSKANPKKVVKKKAATKKKAAAKKSSKHKMK
jgi:hypothetical protein